MTQLHTVVHSSYRWIVILMRIMTYRKVGQTNNIMLRPESKNNHLFNIE